MTTSTSFAAAVPCLQATAPITTVPACKKDKMDRGGTMTLLALALGSFVIGTSEFASMGIIQLFSASLGVSVSRATNAIAAYAFGVVIGAPLVTLGAAGLNRRTGAGAHPRCGQKDTRGRRHTITCSDQTTRAFRRVSEGNQTDQQGCGADHGIASLRRIPLCAG